MPSIGWDEFGPAYFPPGVPAKEEFRVMGLALLILGTLVVAVAAYVPDWAIPEPKHRKEPAAVMTDADRASTNAEFRQGTTAIGIVFLVLAGLMVAPWPEQKEEEANAPATPGNSG